MTTLRALCLMPKQETSDARQTMSILHLVASTAARSTLATGMLAALCPQSLVVLAVVVEPIQAATEADTMCRVQVAEEPEGHL